MPPRGLVRGGDSAGTLRPNAKLFVTVVRALCEAEEPAPEEGLQVHDRRP